MYLRRDVYESLSAAASLPTFAQLKGPDATLVGKTLLDFKKSGVVNSPEVRDQIAKLNAQLNKEIANYTVKLIEAGDVTTTFNKEDFAKLPKFVQELISSSEVNEKKKPEEDFKVRDGDQNVMVAIYTKCDDEKLRERAWKTRHGYAKEETMELATKIINLRKALAKALGYKSWADYVIDGRMAENSENVDKMYNSILPKFNELKDKETAKFIALKKEITGKEVTELNPWDLSYLEQKTKEKEFKIDTEALRDYFPLQTVINGTFNVYGNLFSIKFEKYNGVYDKWNEDVELYKISDTKTNGLLGFVYLDLFARGGKENGAWMGGIVPRQTYKGHNTRPTAHVVLNLSPKNTGEVDTYLDYKEMETFFHEFGHAVHETLTQSPHASLAGASVEWDFVEAPSQTMEYFLTDSRILTQLSKHKVTGESIPLEITKRLEASGKVAPGYFSLRQTSFGKLDLEYYSRNVNEPDFTAEEVTKIGDSTISKYYTKIPEGTGFTSSFSHIISGNYHGAYYAYMWADIVSADCAAKFRDSPEGFVNPELGRQWREKVLEKGSTEKARDMVKDFLGRDYNLDEFLKGLDK